MPYPLLIPEPAGETPAATKGERRSTQIVVAGVPPAILFFVWAVVSRVPAVKRSSTHHAPERLFRPRVFAFGKSLDGFFSELTIGMGARDLDEHRQA